MTYDVPLTDYMYKYNVKFQPIFETRVTIGFAAVVQNVSNNVKIKTIIDVIWVFFGRLKIIGQHCNDMSAMARQIFRIT